METQTLVSGFCSNSTISSLKFTKTPFFPSQSLSPVAESLNRISLKPHNFKPTKLSNSLNNKLECVNSVGKDSNFIATKVITGNGVARKKLAVFVSGGGSNFKSIHEAILKGSVHGEIGVLVTNKNGCGGAEYARNKGIPVIVFPRTKDNSEGLSSIDLINTLKEYKVDFIILAGFLKLIPAELIRAYPRSILNIHPSLLPAFGGKGYFGMKVHKAVIASGARFSGPTIHFVDEHYDTGRILAQRVVPVLTNDTAEELASRVLHEEHGLYVEVITAICDERIVWRGDGVPLIQSTVNPNHYS